MLFRSRTAAARDQQMKQLLAIQFTRIEANNTQVMPANVPWQTANAGPKTNPFKGAVAQSLAEGGYQMAMTAPTAVPSDGSSAVPQVASEYRATSASLDQVLNEISMQPIPDSADEDAAETITAPPKRKPVTAPNVRSPSKPVAVPSKVQVASYQASADRKSTRLNSSHT